MEYVVAGWAQCSSRAVLPFSLQHGSNYSLQKMCPQDKCVLSYCVAETQQRVYKSKTQVNSEEQQLDPDECASPSATD